MFKVYSEKEIFENIVVFNNESPNWYKIFCNHSEIHLNMTDAELDSELIQGTPIFEYILATGGRSPVTEKAFIDSIYIDNSVVIQKPRSVFFLNYSKVIADSIQDSFGVIVQGNKEIDDTSLKGSFFKDIVKDAVFENQTTRGWSNLINFTLPPSNSMVITDEYLFSNDENGINFGQTNLIQLIDAFLPYNMIIPFHILIVSNDQPDPRKTAKSDAWCIRITRELKTEIEVLRNYPILVEIVFTKTIHKRKLILNYINATTDKGFAIFKADDGKTVRDDNDFRCDRIFNRVDPSEGDTDYLVTKAVLIKLKRKCASVKQFVGNAGQSTQNRILGDCNPDFTVKNRLINDV